MYTQYNSGDIVEAYPVYGNACRFFRVRKYVSPKRMTVEELAIVHGPYEGDSISGSSTYELEHPLRVIHLYTATYSVAFGWSVRDGSDENRVCFGDIVNDVHKHYRQEYYH